MPRAASITGRTSRLLMLINLPRPKPARTGNVLQPFTDKLLSVALPIWLSMTYDQGREMAMHKKLSEQTGMAVTSAIRTVRVSAAPTRTPTARFVSTCPRARICRSSTRGSSMRLPMKSMAGPEKASGYDHRWWSTVSYSSMTRSTQASFFKDSGVALQF
jgi:hypothetical protein